MAAPQSPAQVLASLETVRRACLENPGQYVTVVPAVVPVLQGQQDVEIRRWGADFVAEAFANPIIPGNDKQSMVVPTVVSLLRAMLENHHEDIVVVKSAIQACASIYPYVFRKLIADATLLGIYQDISGIKLNILNRLDVAPMPVRIACIKFVQKVVQVQTPGVIADPRRPEHNETSIALVPRAHQLLQLPMLEAETSALTDRLLSVIQENSIDPLLIDATMNSLAVLIKTRPAIQAKVLQTVLNYNPLRAANGPMTSRQVVVIKSLQRTTRALLRFTMRIMPQNPMAEKIDLYLRRLQSNTTAVFTQAANLKRRASELEQPDASKRLKLENEEKPFPPMPRPPVSYTQLFSLTDNPEFQQFDVRILPEQTVVLIANALMQHIDSKSLDLAIEEVERRLETLREAANAAAGNSAEDDDDYDPEALSGTEKSTAPEAQALEEFLPQPGLELGPVELPKPEPLTEEELGMLSMQTVAHVFETALIAEQNGVPVKQKLGINRLAASNNDKESWLTLLIRLATRAPAGLDELIQEKEDTNGLLPVKQEDPLGLDKPTVASMIRKQLFDYIMGDWKHRLSLAITWLNEEWYADKIQAIGTQNGTEPTTKPDTRTLHYDFWSKQLFQTLIPRFDDHKLLIRFLSEIPAINHDILVLITPLARDPLTIRICKMALQYLYTFRPPVRELVVEVLTELWRDGDADMRETFGPLLQKWKPNFIEEAVEETKKAMDETRIFPNGVKAEEIPAA